MAYRSSQSEVEPLPTPQLQQCQIPKPLCHIGNSCFTIIVKNFRTWQSGRNRIQSQLEWASTPALSLSSHVTLRKLLNLAELLSPRGDFCLFFLFFVFYTPPAVYAGFQDRGQIRAAAAGLRQSHGNIESESHLQPYRGLRHHQLLIPRSEARDGNSFLSFFFSPVSSCEK